MSGPRRATVRIQLPPRSGLQTTVPQTIFDPRLRSAAPDLPPPPAEIRVPGLELQPQSPRPEPTPTKKYTPEEIKAKPDIVLRRQEYQTEDGRSRTLPRGTRTLAVVAKEAVPPAAGDVPVSGTLKYYPAPVAKQPSLPKWLGGKPTAQQMLAVDFMTSYEKGSAFSAFQKLIEISEKSGRPIYSSTLVPQFSDNSPKARGKSPLIDVGKALGEKASTYDVLKKDYPQLRYREVPGLTTSGKFWANVYPPVSSEARPNGGPGPYRVEARFRTMDELRSVVNQIPKESLYNPHTKTHIGGLVSTTRPDMVQRALNVGYQVGPVAAEAVPKLVRGGLPIAAQVAAEDVIRAGLNQAPAAAGYAPTQSGSGTTADRLNRFASRVTAGAAVGGALGSVTGPGALATATTGAVAAGAYDLAETGVEMARRYYQNVEVPVRERLNTRPSFTAQMYPNGYPGLPTNIR